MRLRGNGRFRAMAEPGKGIRVSVLAKFQLLPMPEHDCRPLEEVFGEVQSRILKARGISLYVNFDGTLAPITINPDDVYLPVPTRVALERIAWRPRMLTSVFTGRSLFDARKRIGVPGIVYAGNHGLEINGSGLMFVEPAAAAAQETLEAACETLEARLKGVPGVRVENKRLTASVHYGPARGEALSAVETAINETLRFHPGPFRVEPGPHAFEILPETKWNKALAVQLIQDFLAEEGAQIVYFGDHASDEEAFQVLRDGITVKVGDPKQTAARYWVPDPAKVGDFLLWLADAALTAGAAG